MKKKLITAALLVVLCVGTLFTGFSFSVFVSETIYEESVSHLSEIFHQANQTLNSLVSVNWSRMNMWAPYLKETQDVEQIDAYIEKARQESRSILLDSGAFVESRPQLEIYADDVECSHGCTSGFLSEEELFYMRSRGIPEKEARHLQKIAFLAPVLRRLPEDLVKEVYDSLS